MKKFMKFGAVGLSVIAIVFGCLALKTSAAAPANKLFNQGMVTLSFDDGWESQYQNALPVLKSANLPGSFYIITNAMQNADGLQNPNRLCNDANTPTCDGAIISTTANSWTASGQYPDPAQSAYTFQESLKSSAPVTLAVSYFNQNGKPIADEQNISLATFPISSSVQNQSVTFTIPKSVMNKPNISFTLKESVAAKETMTVTNSTLVEYLGTADTYMTTAQVTDLANAGNEIGAHTMDHCDLLMLESDPNSGSVGNDGPPGSACATQLDAPSTPAQQINGSLSALIADGFKVTTFAYPYGSYDANIETLLKTAGFAGARTTSPGFNTRATDPNALLMQNVNRATTNKGIGAVQNWITTAQTKKQWLVLMFHNVEPMNAIKANGDSDATTPDYFQQVVDYLKSNNVCVVTMDQGLHAMNDATFDPCQK